MIIHKLNNGRLGNQLFQIAATLAHAKKMGVKAQFTKWEYNKYFINGIDDNLDTTYDARFNGEFHPPYYGFDFEYKPIPNDENLILHGFFQSEKYFDTEKETIINAFKPKNEFLQVVRQAGKDFLNLQNTVAVHIRRGDYVNLQDAHPDLNQTPYYETAFERIINEMPNSIKNWLIFSDDIEWCKSRFYSYNVNYVEGNSDIVDLFLMAQCKNHIIANSSFSWWAAWLSKNMFNNQGITIAPNNWFGPSLSHYNTKDLYLPEWIKI